MKSSCRILLYAILLPAICLAQEWVVRYNGPIDSSDAAHAIALDDLGNVYVTGSSRGTGSWYDYATVKYDAIGVEQWVARYDGPGNGFDIANGIVVDDAGNVYVTGHCMIDSLSNHYDYATVKYDSLGVEQWVVRYGPYNESDESLAIILDNAGNVYITGGSAGPSGDHDYATVKYDSMGVEQWVARYDGPGNRRDMATAIAVDNANNVYITGVSMDFNDDDYATVKYDSMGVEQWVARYIGPGNSQDYASAIALDNMGNVYITGLSYGLGTLEDYATVKYDSAGVEQWVARYVGPVLDGRDIANAIALDNAGNVYVTGYSADFGTLYDYVTVKYDSSGVEQWVARYNGPSDQIDKANAIAVDNADNIYITGTSAGPNGDYDYATVKYDSSGVELAVARYDGPSNDYDAAYAIATDSLGNVYVTGSSRELGTSTDYATLKYLPLGVKEEKTASPIKKQDTGGVTIISGPLLLPQGVECRVFDITGRVIAPEKIKPGIYFIEIEGQITRKVVKIR